jgi:hypothetical protein
MNERDLAAHARRAKTKPSTKPSKTKAPAPPPPAARMGRPSLISGKGARIAFRCPAALRAKLEARADALGVSLSDAVALVLQAGLDAA